MDATVERTRDGYSRTLAKFGNPDATNGWTRNANHDLSEFRGESVRISFDCRTDGSLKTNFYLDDLRLMATMPSASDPVWKGMDENWNNSSFPISPTSPDNSPKSPPCGLWSPTLAKARPGLSRASS